MHKPVLLNEVIEALNPRDGEIFVDTTFGAGGYSRAILEKANCSVIAFDRDENVIQIAKQVKSEFKERFSFYHTTFGLIDQILKEIKVDGIVADFGASSMQFDEVVRGFSFLKEAKLDMRMGLASSPSAHFLVNNFPEPRLAEIILKYGEERLAKKIANFIAKERAIKTIETTTQLASIIREAYGSEARYVKIHPATKTFQAFRIFINNELSEIEELLEKSKVLLKSNGRLVLVSFHSLEDGIVKNFFLKNSKKKKKTNKYATFSMQQTKEEEAIFNIVSDGIIIPKKEELDANIRSRSAHLRWAIKNSLTK